MFKIIKMNLLIIIASEGGRSSENCNWTVINLEKALLHFEFVNPNEKVLTLLNDMRDSPDAHYQTYWDNRYEDDEDSEEDEEEPYAFDIDEIGAELDDLLMDAKHYHVEFPCFIDKQIQVYEY